jgi:GH18 family chitinase
LLLLLYREFPNFNDNAPQEVDDFTTLMVEMAAATKEAGLLLTTAMRATPDPQKHANIKAVADAVDFINLMTYDYHGGFAMPVDTNRWVVG